MSDWTLLTWQYVQVLAHVALACLVGLWLFIYHCVSSVLRSCVYIHLVCQMIMQLYGRLPEDDASCFEMCWSS